MNDILTSTDDDQVPPGRPGIDEPRFVLRLDPSIGIRADDAMSEAGRKILFHEFEIMLKHEPGARAGGDIEAIHDMRVATRRMRSAIPMFKPYYRRGKQIERFNKSLRKVAAALGGVRDLDVFQVTIDHYMETQSEDAQEGLQAFRDAFNTPLATARERLKSVLDSQSYLEFLDAFHEFLTTPGAGSLTHLGPQTPHTVRHVLPRLIYEQYTAMRSYETVLGLASLETLHQLRIEGKRFRYTLEFFTEALGDDIKSVISAMKAVQDHLGNLHDTQVASDLLRAHLQAADPRHDMRAVLQYLSSREAEKQRLLAGVPEAWAAFTVLEIRQTLGLAVANL